MHSEKLYENLKPNPIKITRCENLSSGLFVNADGLVMISGNRREKFRQSEGPAILQAEIEDIDTKITLIQFPKDNTQYQKPVLPQDSIGFCFKDKKLILAIADGVTDPFNQYSYLNESGQYADEIVMASAKIDPSHSLEMQMKIAAMQIESKRKPMQTGAAVAQWLVLDKPDRFIDSSVTATQIGPNQDLNNPIVENGGYVMGVHMPNNRSGFIGYKDQWQINSYDFKIDTFSRIFLSTDGLKIPTKDQKAIYSSFKYGGLYRHFYGFNEVDNFVQLLKNFITPDDASMIIVEV